MNGKRWKRSKTVVYNIGYHLIWCPKYRVESVGHISEETIRKYIEDQKGK